MSSHNVAYFRNELKIVTLPMSSTHSPLAIIVALIGLSAIATHVDVVESKHLQEVNACVLSNTLLTPSEQHLTVIILGIAKVVRLIINYSHKMLEFS